MKYRSYIGVLFLVAVTVRTADGQMSTATDYHADSAAVVAAVAGYHAALAAGDTTGAIALLDASAIVLESGEIESRQEYIAHHLAADMAFAKAVSSPSRVRAVKVLGDMAWVASTNRSTGTFNGRPIDSDGAELMVLHRVAGAWKIGTIHWSSHRRAPR